MSITTAESLPHCHSFDQSTGKQLCECGNIKEIVMKPLYEKIYVEVLPVEEKTAGGIYMPDEMERKTRLGKVLATGNGRISSGKILPLEVKVGDTVMFGTYVGTPIDDTHRIMREEDILGIIE